MKNEGFSLSSDETHKFVDFYKVGKLNYNAQQKNVDWKKFKADVIKRLDKYSKRYYIKRDLENFTD